MRPINVLSLFDGISGGLLALKRASIPVNYYFSSEIDKFAIRISRYNFPDVVQIGDVENVSGDNLPQIDLLFGGFPCQPFSKSGNKLNFDDPRGKLFWEYVRIQKALKPRWFLAENVNMKKEYQDVISKYLGVDPILLNSSFVSAQNRERLYWTNIPFIGFPEERGKLLKDVLESGITDRDKSYCIDANYHKGSNLNNYFLKKRRQIVFEGKNRCYQVGEADIKGIESIKRVYSPEGKSPTLTAMQGGHREPKVSEDNLTWRKLTPIECERLQTLPDNFTKWGLNEKNEIVEMSKTQRYKTIGNGWNIDTIVHLLKGVPNV